MFREYDYVKAVTVIENKVFRGSKGTVLIVYNSTPPHYEVEFFDEDGQALGLFTVQEKDIIFIEPNLEN